MKREASASRPASPLSWLVFLVLVPRRPPRPRSAALQRGQPADETLRAAERAAQDATAGQDAAAHDPGFAWIPVVVLVALLAIGRGWSWSGERPQAPRATRCTTSRRWREALADVLDESLDDLRAERDPRRAVIARLRAARARARARTGSRGGRPRRRSSTCDASSASSR